MANLRRILGASILYWLPLAVLTILMSGLVYVAVQQDYRNSANDPQIQMALDARNALENGAAAQSLVPTSQVDIAQSLAPYLAIYDASGQVVAASATLHGQPLVVPPGVFDSARAMPMDVLTWMPEPGVRSAIVVVHYSQGYVLAGRSLIQVEDRETNLEKIVGAACVVTLVVTFGAVVVSRALASWSRLASGEAR